MKFLIPNISLFGVPIVCVMLWAKKAHYDGVEILLTPFTRRRIMVYRKFAKNFGLTVHYHQAWSLSENPTLFFNHILSKVGYLPRSGYKLNEHIPASVDEPVVIYADRYQEVRGHRNWSLQTCSVFEGRRYKLPYRKYVEIVKEENFPVVFDIQHVLEFMLDIIGVEGLLRQKESLLELLKIAWEELGPHVNEIHLNDCDPRLGHSGGRNIFLGEGVMPLGEFCAMVKNSGWNGTITTEVAFSHLKYRLSRLTELNRRARELFKLE
jgi:hypothetical protein